jgi:hypothetical protein
MLLSRGVSVSATVEPAALAIFEAGLAWRYAVVDIATTRALQNFLSATAPFVFMERAWPAANALPDVAELCALVLAAREYLGFSD